MGRGSARRNRDRPRGSVDQKDASEECASEDGDRMGRGSARRNRDRRRESVDQKEDAGTKNKLEDSDVVEQCQERHHEARETDEHDGGNSSRAPGKKRATHDDRLKARNDERRMVIKHGWRERRDSPSEGSSRSSSGLRGDRCGPRRGIRPRPRDPGGPGHWSGSIRYAVSKNITLEFEAVAQEGSVVRRNGSEVELWRGEGGRRLGRPTGSECS